MKNLITCITLLSLTACSSQIRITEHPTNKEAKLAGFASYCWSDDNNDENVLVKIEPAGGHHKTFDPAIRATINSSLDQKGYEQTHCSTANFMIDYRMGLHEDVAAIDATFNDSPVNPYGPRWSIGDDNKVSYEGLAEPEEEIITVRHGTIHIAAFSHKNKILWHSSAEKTLNDQDSDTQRKANLLKAISEIMRVFPATSQAR